MVDFRILLTLLFVYVSAEMDYIRLSPDCTILGTKIPSSVKNGECKTVSVVNLEPGVLLVLRAKSPSVLEYATFFGNRPERTEKVLSFRSISLSHVLGNCTLKTDSLTAFMDLRTLYIAANCGHIQALVRSIVYSTRMIYTPPGSLTFLSSSPNTRFFGVSPSIKLRNVSSNLFVGKIFEIPIKNGTAAVRSITTINTTTPDHTFKPGSVIYQYGEIADGIMVGVKADGNVRFGYLNINVTNFTETCEVIRNVGNSLFFCFLDTPVGHGDEYTWMDGGLVNDGWFSKTKRRLPNMTESIQHCQKQTQRKAKPSTILFVLIVTELTVMLGTIIAFSSCVCNKKKAIYEEYKNAKLEGTS